MVKNYTFLSLLDQRQLLLAETARIPLIIFATLPAASHNEILN